jgi:hypothetical protein
MLTDAERKWLQERENVPLFQCEKYCEYHVGKNSYFECTYSPALSQEWCKNDAGNQDWKDAAEFEARVAVYLAKSPCLTCPDNPRNCPRENTPEKGRPFLEACRMKHARIAVEQEMEQEALCLKS